MISKTAQADVEELWDAGLKPTFQDIIRLNALALAVERVRSGFALSTLPRVAFLGSAALREPTIGSEMWMELASRLFDSKDCETFIMLRAFSMSRPPAELPDPANEAAVLQALDAFRNSIGFATVRQLIAAISYAVHGFDPASGEVAAKRADAPAEHAAPADDDCYEVGLLHMGMLYRLGSAADIKALSPRAVQELLYRAISRDSETDARKSAVYAAEDDYTRTLDEITERLKSNG